MKLVKNVLWRDAWSGPMSEKKIKLLNIMVSSKFLLSNSYLDFSTAATGNKYCIQIPLSTVNKQTDQCPQLETARQLGWSMQCILSSYTCLSSVLNRASRDVDKGSTIGGYNHYCKRILVVQLYWCQGKCAIYSQTMLCLHSKIFYLSVANWCVWKNFMVNITFTVYSCVSLILCIPLEFFMNAHFSLYSTSIY